MLSGCKAGGRWASVDGRRAVEGLVPPLAEPSVVVVVASLGPPADEEDDAVSLPAAPAERTDRGEEVMVGCCSVAVVVAEAFVVC